MGFVHRGNQEIYKQAKLRYVLSDLSLYKLDVDNKIIYIQLEDISIIKFLREKYIVQIEDIFSRMLGDDFQVVIKSKDEYKSNKIDKKKKVRKSLYKDNSKLLILNLILKTSLLEVTTDSHMPHHSRLPSHLRKLTILFSYMEDPDLVRLTSCRPLEFRL